MSEIDTECSQRLMIFVVQGRSRFMRLFNCGVLPSTLVML